MNPETLVDWNEHKKMDPIPASVKNQFFAGVDPPNYTKDYDAVGFDADFCLVHYKHKAFLTMLA